MSQSIPLCRIEVYDWDADGGHDFIGDCTTSLEGLAEGEGFQIVQVDYQRGRGSR